MLQRVKLPAFALFLIFAVLIYALFGSPTPDHPGWVEAVVGALMILSIGSAGFLKALSFKRPKGFYLNGLYLFFIAGLIVPSFAAIYAGNDPSLIIRDILAFMFLGLPLFLSARLKSYPDAAHIFSYVLIFTGLSFCFRTLLPVFNIWIPQGELLYLSNSPLAIFAAVFLSGLVWSCMLYPSTINTLKGVIATGLVVLVLSAMVLDVQRATIGAVILSFVAFMLASFVETPLRVVIPFALVVVVAILFHPAFETVINAMAHKTATVGLNARIAEAQAVYDQIQQSPVSVLIGQGWGATFSSPAVAGLEVNYTHSLLTTMLLKGGFLLFGLCVFVVMAALYQIFLIFQQDRVRSLCLLWALIIPAFLYASHKSLDFGLVLLMVGVWSVGIKPLPSPASSDKN